MAASPVCSGHGQAYGRLRYAGAIKGDHGADVAAALTPTLKALTADANPLEIDISRKTSRIHGMTPKLIAQVEMPSSRARRSCASRA